MKRKPHEALNLPRTGLLASASEGTMQVLAAIAKEIRLSPRETLFEQSDMGDTLYVVQDGLMEVSVVSGEGRRLLLDVLRAGDLAGEIALLDPGPRTATVSARVDSKLLSITRSDVLDAAARDPQIGIDLAAMAAARMRSISQQLHEQVFLPLPQRLARKILHLIDLAEPQDELHITQSELAEFIGATREAVSKCLASWRNDRIIDMSRQKLAINDRDALWALAGIDLI